MEKPAKKTQKSQTKKRRGVDKIDGTPLHVWLVITMVLFIVMTVASGWAKTRFEEVEYIGSIPIDPYTGILFLVAALFLPLTIALKHIFGRRPSSA